MRLFTRFSKGLLAAGILAACSFGMSACGPDYAIFRVDVTSTTPDTRNKIEECRMTITDENGKPVLDNYPLGYLLATDTSGITYAKQGCYAGLTPAKVGTFSYSTSRSSGSLTFVVNALDNGGNTVQKGCATQAVKAYPPEVSVPLTFATTFNCP